MIKNYLLKNVSKNWFIFSIVGVILLAKYDPELGKLYGPLKPEITVKYLAVMIIFFNSGLVLNTEILWQTLKNFKVHVLIQGFTFVVFPVCMTLVIRVLKTAGENSGLLSFLNLSENLYLGLAILACMPPPVSSAVILTKSIGGDEVVAIFNSVFGSFLGIFISPILINEIMRFLPTEITRHLEISTNLDAKTSALSNEMTDLPIFKVFKSLTITVIFPIIVGQIFRQNRKVKNFLDQKKPPFGTIGSAILLFIIYTTFCDTFSDKSSSIYQIQVWELVLLILMISFFQLVLLFLLFQFSNLVLLSGKAKSKFSNHHQKFASKSSQFRSKKITSVESSNFTSQQVVAILFCSTHKSLTLGIPMLKIIYHTHPNLSLFTIPLLIYHPCQILIGSLLVNYLKNWLDSKEYVYSKLKYELPV